MNIILESNYCHFISFISSQPTHLAPTWCAEDVSIFKLSLQHVDADMRKSVKCAYIFIVDTACK